MSKHIFNEFNKEVPIKINRLLVRNLYTFVQTFETKKDHALALNTQLLGVYPIAFTSKDREEFFNIFGVDRLFIKDIIDKIPSIDINHKVPSDPMNVLVTWILHCGYTTKNITNVDKEIFLVSLLKIWLYRFFTSLVNYNFPYLANPGIMQATVNQLSNKYDIIRDGSWKNVIENRSKDIIANSSIHIKAIRTYDDDKAIIYLITDTQTRMRNRIKNIVSAYHETKKLGDTVGSYGSVGDLDGEKIITNQVSVLDNMISNLTNEMMNTNAFVDDKAIRVISGLFSSFKPDTLRFVLMRFSQLASSQSNSKDLEEIIRTKDGEIYVGTRVLVRNIIQKSYRFCIKNKVNLKSRVEILNKLRNLYSSSRISDKELMQVKLSVAYFIDKQSTTKREATLSSLRIAFILYIILKTFRYL